MPRDSLDALRKEFVDQWGALGTAWGISRSMAQIHARLLVADEPMSTDDLMDDLGISRGNANTNLRDLVAWGLIGPIVLRGERKQYFEAEKRVWRIFCIVARERKRRELDPALRMLNQLKERARALDGKSAKGFERQLARLADFLETCSRILDKVVAREQNDVLPAILRLFR